MSYEEALKTYGPLVEQAIQRLKVVEDIQPEVVDDCRQAGVLAIFETIDRIHKKANQQQTDISKAVKERIKSEIWNCIKGTMDVSTFSELGYNFVNNISYTLEEPEL